MTNAAGSASIELVLGARAGVQTLVVSAPGTDAPALAVDIAVESPPAGVISTTVNSDHLAGKPSLPGPAATSRIGRPSGAFVTSDGAIYFSDAGTDGHKIRRVNADGVLSDIAGIDGLPGFGGDGGPARAAALDDPRDVVVDESSWRLYIADFGNGRVRMADLLAGTIDTVATNLDQPANLTLAPDSALWFSEAGGDRVWRLAPDGSQQAGDLSLELEADATKTACTEGDDPILVSCGDGCPIAIYSDGSMTPGVFVAGRIACGASGASPIAPTPGIVRLDDHGRLHHVAGHRYGDDPGTGAAATVRFEPIRGLVFDTLGNLYVTAGQRILAIDGRTGRTNIVAGSGSAGGSGDWASADEARLSNPRGLAMTQAGDLVVADWGNHAIRTIWGVQPETTTLPYLVAVDGDEESAMIGSRIDELRVQLLLDGIAVRGARIDFLAKTQGIALDASYLLTDPELGLAIMGGSAPLTPGAHSVDACFFDIHGRHAPGSPVEFTIHITEPPPRTMLSQLNATHLAGDEGVPGPSTIARVQQVHGVTTDADGNTYVSEWSGNRGHRVLRITRDGYVTVVAGADGELLRPFGLAVDDARGVLYIADTGNDRVWRVFLASGVGDVWAGGGEASEAPYGDEGHRLDATFSHPTHLQLMEGGHLLVTDAEHNRIRRIDAYSNLVSTVLEAPEGGVTCGSQPVLRSCSGGCAMALRNDSLYLTGRFSCGGLSATGAPLVPAIVRLDADGTLHRVAGLYGGTTVEGSSALETAVPISDGIAVSTADEVYYVDGNTIRRISPGLQLVRTNAGLEQAGSGGDFGPPELAQMKLPKGIAISDDGHMMIADRANASVRMIWNVAP